ncbi:hypothetical protein B0G71_0081 [Paraburkholderia sp. BL27I4N3]|uniref:hypothetical protein n=1 Tax=Paraburkholderia sp. BL27I4N3 TaxID=1938805 RepID=UPI000E252D43|nr:hypothetical protein [Paraburkholderia sp. BL27I4N3]REE17143.1 hypothetical protein B0G71_0081 [Paraburkholderia sp. BL27I4N3]
MTLLEQARTLKEGLGYLETVSDNGEEVRELHEQKRTLRALTEPLNLSRQSVLRLRSGNVQVELPESLVGEVVKLATDVRRKMEKKPGPQTLKSGKEWSTLLDKMRTLNKTLEASGKSGWKAYVVEKITSDPPGTIKSRTADTTENRQRIREYEVIYTRLQQIGQSLPSDVAAISEVETLSLSLSAAYGKIDFDVPEAVRLFLDGANSATGAPLSLLTEEVLDWLKCRQEDGLYSVRARVN